MNQDEKIHVMPKGDHWEVEAQSGHALAEEAKKAAAIKKARGIARDEGAEAVIVHEGDGVTTEIPTPHRRTRSGR